MRDDENNGNNKKGKMMESHFWLNVQGKQRKVFYSNFRYNDRGQMEYSARIREPGTGSSVRGTLVQTKQGWRFRPANKSSLAALS